MPKFPLGRVRKRSRKNELASEPLMTALLTSTEPAVPSESASAELASVSITDPVHLTAGAPVASTSAPTDPAEPTESAAASVSTESVHLTAGAPVASVLALKNDLLPLMTQFGGWTITNNSSNSILLVKSVHTAEVPLIFSIMIDDSLSWRIYLGQKLISCCDVFRNMEPTISDASGILSLLNLIDSKQICLGNHGEKYWNLTEWKNNNFPNRQRNGKVAYIEHGILPFPTIRHHECQMLVDRSSFSMKCPTCMKYTSTLRLLLWRKQHANVSTRNDPHSKMNDRWRSKEELKSKMDSLTEEIRIANNRVKKLEVKIAELTESVGVEVDTTTNEDIISIMEENAENITSKYPKDTFPHIFWESQLKAAKLKNSKSMKWHPLMIRWSIYLRHLSGKGYNQLRESGCVALPSDRTLRDYTYYNETQIGFSADTDRELLGKVKDFKPHQKMVTLSMDEMYICEGVVYDRKSGQVMGFTDLGDITNHLLSLEREATGESQANNVAKTMLAFMVRGLCSSLEYPYGQFACRNLTSEQMYRPVTEAICRLEKLGLKVLVISADGASTNRCLFSLLSSGNTEPQEMVYKMPNPYTDESRNIYFISDPPHLIKTIRNCMSNKKRTLENGGGKIMWEHLEELYRRDSGADRNFGGFCYVPKLKYEHLHLTGFSKMRVDLAAQALSETVSNALLKVVGPEAKETAKLILMVDRFFDCLNVRNLTNAKRQRKPYRSPYRCGEDWKLKWLEGPFLKYFNDWEDGVMKMTHIPVRQRKKMLLSKETLDGIYMTVKAFGEVVRYIFKVQGVKFFLSDHINQDPLEKFFGCQRQRGAGHENPTVPQFCKNTQALRVVGSFCRPAVKGNCRGSNKRKDYPKITDKELLPLNKRRKRSS